MWCCHVSTLIYGDMAGNRQQAVGNIEIIPFFLELELLQLLLMLDNGEALTFICQSSPGNKN
ncbi:hypothetical protein H6G98_18725 [Nostoc sp. FACHB-857]|nr:hypothetical protein [Nostoc sp. FACHB-857]